MTICMFLHGKYVVEHRLFHLQLFLKNLHSNFSFADVKNWFSVELPCQASEYFSCRYYHGDYSPADWILGDDDSFD